MCAARDVNDHFEYKKDCNQAAQDIMQARDVSENLVDIMGERLPAIPEPTGIRLQ